MRFKSASQKRLFQAAAHNRKFAKKVGISMKTAKKVVAANKRKK
jgi:hypothetical protein